MTYSFKIAFQGELGAYSHLALQNCFPNATSVSALSFKDAMNHVSQERADAAMIPVENSQWGRVSDVHFLLPETDLHITGEIFHRVQHQLLGIKGSQIDQITHVHSHPQALGQCSATITALGITPMAAYDTAGAAKMIAKQGDPTQAAIASALAGTIYDLDVLQSNFEDQGHNTTRFIIMQKVGRAPLCPPQEAQPMLTAFLFTTRNIPAALYKVMGGFATNNVNMVRLESYVNPTKFTSSTFYAEISGNQADQNVQNAFDELQFFATDFKILGSFGADSFR